MSELLPESLAKSSPSQAHPFPSASPSPSAGPHPLLSGTSERGGRTTEPPEVVEEPYNIHVLWGKGSTRSLVRLLSN